VSGPTEAVQHLHARLVAQDIAARPLHTSHAFHSAMMQPILAPFTAYVSRMPLNAPQIPFMSSVTGTWITPAAATDARYWAHHCRHTVAFSAGIQALLEDTHRVFLEVGPGNTLSTFARQHVAPGERRVVVSSLRHPQDDHPDVAFLLRTLGQLWLAGIRVDWPALYGHKQRHRLPLPTYPFERKRYWIEPPTTHGSSAPHRSPDKQPDIADWFYTPSWKRSSFLGCDVSAQLAAHKHRWLVFTDRQGLGERLIARLQQSGQEVYTVAQAAQFTQLGSHAYAINPGASEDYTAVLDTLYEAGKAPDMVVHLWGIGPDEPSSLTLARVAKAQELGFYSLCYLAQAFGKQPVTSVSITVVSNHMQEVTGEECLCPEKVTMLGAVKIIPQEYPHLHCRSLDVVYSPRENGNELGLIEQILVECLTPSAEPMVAYRGKHRWVPTVTSVRLDGQANGTPRLRKHGVYLITGGLGGVGLALAEYLAQTVQPKLILTGRTAFPARDAWNPWLAAHADDDDVSCKIRHVQALEALGTEVWVAHADVANLDHMREVVTQAEVRFGQINGVIHCAGIPDHAGVIERRSSEETERVLAPKVRGTCVLDHLLQHVALDFFVLCSSLGSVLYKLKCGEVGYCDANDFLDAFAAHKTSRDGTCTVSINWTDWQEVGMAVQARQVRARAALFHTFFPERGGLSTAEGKEVFERILANPRPQVMVSTQDLHALMAQHDALTMAELLATAHMAGQSHATPARPELHQAYAAPRNALEQTITDIWQQLFGIAQVGIHDDFFELGGHSLLATQLLNRLHQDCSGNTLSLRTVFTHPTVAGLAQIIAQNASPLVDQEQDASAPDLNALLTTIEQMSDTEVERFLQSDG
jgi:acyl transferase domain-containing protein